MPAAQQAAGSAEQPRAGQQEKRGGAAPWGGQEIMSSTQGSPGLGEVPLPHVPGGASQPR